MSKQAEYAKQIADAGYARSFDGVADAVAAILAGIEERLPKADQWAHSHPRPSVSEDIKAALAQVVERQEEDPPPYGRTYQGAWVEPSIKRGPGPNGPPKGGEPAERPAGDTYERMPGDPPMELPEALARASRAAERPAGEAKCNGCGRPLRECEGMCAIEPPEPTSATRTVWVHDPFDIENAISGALDGVYGGTLEEVERDAKTTENIYKMTIIAERQVPAERPEEEAAPPEVKTESLLRDHPWLAKDTDEDRLDEFARLLGLHSFGAQDVLMFTRANLARQAAEHELAMRSAMEDNGRLRIVITRRVAELAEVEAIYRDAKRDLSMMQRRAESAEADMAEARSLLLDANVRADANAQAARDLERAKELMQHDDVRLTGPVGICEELRRLLGIG